MSCPQPLAALCLLGLVAALLALPPTRAAADQTLYSFGKGFKLNTVPTRDVKLSLVTRDGRPVLRLATGHRRAWPGIDLKATFGPWNLSAFAYVAVDIHNSGDTSVSVHCRVDNPGADGVHNCLTGSLELAAGQSGALRVPLRRPAPAIAGIKFFGMRGAPLGMSGGAVIDPTCIVNLVIFVARPSEDHVFEISNVRAGGHYVAPPEAAMKAADFFPFIDQFGQYMHRDWPGKTHTEADFAAHLQAEEKDLAAHPGPAGWDKYGGWEAGPKLEATGFFRTEKYQGKWWLVDPDGRLFFSHGVDCVTPYEGATPLDDRDNWFSNLPPPDGKFKECYGRAGHVVNGYYKGRNPRTFDFARANLIRKYGSDYLQRFADMSQRRLRSWGLNTIANWSAPEIYLLRRTPYVVSINFGGKQLAGSRGYWGKFRDVFAPGFAAAVSQRMAREVGKSANDPWCLGYFVDNELSWGDDVSLAVAALVSPPDQPAKQVFIADLKARYGAIEKLNKAWGGKYASWEALAQSRQAPDRKRAHADLIAFDAKTADTYFRTIRAAVKAVAPHNLYLGCRFSSVNDLAFAAAAKYCDVVSYNLYRRSVADFHCPAGTDVPLIIGEFHFGALDRGMFHAGLVPVANQEARAQAYRDYVQGALRNPAFVGAGWFKYMDEPTTGRALDGENYQIGLVDCCDTPYTETIAAVREVGYNLYRYRLEAK